MSECGLASGRWLKSTQAYRKMRRQHPLDHRQDAQLARGASQEAAKRKPGRGDRWSSATQAVSSLPAPLREVVGAPQDPSPLIFRQKPWSLSPQGHGLKLQERQAVSSLEELLVFVCATGRHGSLSQTLAVTGSGGLLRKGDSARTQTKACRSTPVGTGGRQSGGVSATEPASELTRDYSVTGWLAQTA